MKSLSTALMTFVVWGFTSSTVAEVLTVSDAIQTRRFMGSAPVLATVTPSGEFLNSGSSEIFVSPDRKLWAAMMIRGDLERNGNWAEILVGSLESSNATARPHVLARFFTHSFGDGGQGGPVTLTISNARPLTWLADSRHLALLWADDSDRNQIFVVEVPTGKIQQLSKHPTSILAFSTGGDRFIFAADYRTEVASDELWIGGAQGDRKKGVTIETLLLPAVLSGQFDGNLEGPYLYKWHLLDANTGDTQDITGLMLNRIDRAGATFSDDGKFAIVESSVDSVPESWDRYSNEYWHRMIRRARFNRNDLLGRQLIQLYVVDVGRATAWPLWDAPSKPGSRIVWSPDGRMVAISPTFVPTSEATTDGLTGYATAVVEIKSGRYSTIPILPTSPLAAESLGWVDPKTIEIRDGDERYEFRYSEGEWKKISPRRRVAVPRQAAIHVRVEQDMNAPPVVVAVDRRSGRQQLIYDPNPQLKERFALGRIEMIEWRDPEGRAWTGRLNYPTNWRGGNRYPLVIQAINFAPRHQYSLYGGDVGLGPGVTVGVAQPLANRGIFVLNVERKYLMELDKTPRRAEVHAAAYEAAVEYLYRIGLVDRTRVGISGFSNTGYLVQYALVHSNFHYAAAITDDNFDGSYYQAVTMGSGAYAEVNGAEPYGEGLKLWMQRAPAFNADKIRTPLRLQVTSPPPVSILGSWEMFTRLRELDKPVEFFLIPDIQRGSHTIQNPAQCLASQEGAVDWFDFWLNAREDAKAEKADQYARWRKLRVQHNIALQELRTSDADAPSQSHSALPPKLDF